MDNKEMINNLSAKRHELLRKLEDLSRDRNNDVILNRELTQITEEILRLTHIEIEKRNEVLKTMEQTQPTTVEAKDIAKEKYKQATKYYETLIQKYRDLCSEIESIRKEKADYRGTLDKLHKLRGKELTPEEKTFVESIKVE